MPNLTGKAANQVVTHGDLGPLAYYSAEMVSAAVVEQVLVVRDEKTSGTDGGAAVSATWNARTLNTTPTNTITGASVASNLVTLPAGVYDIEADAPSVNTNRHKLRLYNVTGSAVLLLGTSESVSAAIDVTTRSFVKGRITLAVSSALRLEHFTLGANASGLGLNTAAAGVNEVYAQIKIVKVS